MSISERDSKVLWHPFTQMQIEARVPALVRGEGALLFDEQGRSYVDAISSWWVNLHGHANAHIAARLNQQLGKLHHSIFAGFTHEPAVELAEALLAVLPPGLERIFYSDDGSTAVEVALKMALQFWHNRRERRSRVLVLEHSYHGDTFGAMSLSQRGVFSKPFERLLFDVEALAVPGSKGCLERLACALDGGDVAAIVYEPMVQGVGGMRMYPAAEYRELLERCRSAGALLVADEVMTGFGRTGRFFASELLSVNPDLICLSKGLTGGTLPLGVTAVSGRIFDVFLSSSRETMLAHGHSYTANALACSAALASLELLQSAECRASIARVCEAQASACHTLKHDLQIESARSLGTIVAFELDRGASGSYLHEIRDKAYHFALERGVLLRPLGNTVYAMPPYCIKPQELERVHAAMFEMAREFLK